jgi:hypothetical protein
MNMTRRARASELAVDLAADRRVRSGVSLLVLGLLILIALPWAACSARPPSRAEDLCSIFEEKRSWHRSAQRSFERWGIPEWVQLAIVHQESSFRAHARPPRRKVLWVFPGPRVSTAYGYGQVIDPTWEHFVRATGEADASRSDFEDVAQFIGWYGDLIHRKTGVEKVDARHLYLAYHEGPEGYRRGNHARKSWLQAVASRVDERALRYRDQYRSCRERLNERSFFGLF